MNALETRVSRGLNTKLLSSSHNHTGDTAKWFLPWETQNQDGQLEGLLPAQFRRGSWVGVAGGQGMSLPASLCSPPFFVQLPRRGLNNHYLTPQM